MSEESQNASFFFILASDKQENHKKKEKGAGIAKIEGSGRKEGGEGTEKTMVAALVFVLATYLEILADGVSNGLVLLTSALLVI